MIVQNQDEKWMKKAIELASLGQQTTAPNPCVGCVIVKNNKLISTGWHRFAGDAHAEVHALRMAGDLAVGATCYVTLEPCSHYGRTPPCCKALVKAKLNRVVVAIKDPTKKVNGKGIHYLQSHGIDVSIGVLEKASMALNSGFLNKGDK